MLYVIIVYFTMNLESQFTAEVVYDDYKESDYSDLMRDHLRINRNDFDVKDGISCLHYACSMNMRRLVTDILTLHKAEINIDATNSWEETPLHMAIIHNNVSIVETLLKEGADPNIQRGFDGSTALHLAVRKGTYELVLCLLKSPIICVNSKDNENATPLHYSVEVGHCFMVDILLQAGADPNACRRDGKTPLHLVDNVVIANLLIEKGASVDATDDNLATPLYRAISIGNEALVRKLLDEGGCPDLNPIPIYTPIIHLAVTQNNIRLFRMIVERTNLIDVEDINSQYSLGKAIKLGHTEKVKLLLEHNANPNRIYGGNKTFLMDAVEHGNIDIINLLLENGATKYINVESEEGLTPLLIAIKMKREDIVTLLMKNGANVALKKNDRNIPLNTNCFSATTEKDFSTPKSKGQKTHNRKDVPISPLQFALRSANISVFDFFLNIEAYSTDSHASICQTTIDEAVSLKSLCYSNI